MYLLFKWQATVMKRDIEKLNKLPQNKAPHYPLPCQILAISTTDTEPNTHLLGG